MPNTFYKCMAVRNSIQGNPMNPVKPFLLMASLAMTPISLWALSPMHAFYDLVVGQGVTGFADGAFTEACFQYPCGLALNGDGTRLFVADEGNNRIRLVLLNQGNAVTTLAGTGEKMDRDGPLASAAFNDPRLVVWIPSNQLIVYEGAGSRLRRVDLSGGQVQTLLQPQAPELGGVTLVDCNAMVYDPSTQDLYLSQPDQNLLWKIDLAGPSLSVTHFKTPAPLLSPDCLCLYRGHLYASDQSSSKVFQVDFLPKPRHARTLKVTPFAQGSKVQALAANGNDLVALQDDPKPIVCLNSGRAVISPMIWDQPVYYSAGWVFAKPSDWFSTSTSPCLIPDTPHPGQYFLAEFDRNEIIHFRDVEYQDLSAENTEAQPGLMPYGHSMEKTPGTFRVLLVADHRFHEPLSVNSTTGQLPGRSLSAPPPDPTKPQPTSVPYPDVIPDDFSATSAFPLFSLAMRAELSLNTRAALKDDPLSYEVLALDPATFDPAQLSELISKYHVDLVLAVESSSQTPVPSEEWLSQAWAGLKASPGCRMVVSFFPGTGAVADSGAERDETFWANACANQGIPLLDLTASWTALRASFFPVSPAPGEKLNIKGLFLLGWLLSREIAAHQGFSHTEAGISEPLPGPMRQFLDLAAGEGPPGYRDGAFPSALLDGPGGLAMGKDGTTLYVADRKNHRIRTVRLNENNRMDTLAGSGDPVELDGTFPEASFADPALIEDLPDGLVVLEGLSGHLRFLDLKSRKVSTWKVREKGEPLPPDRLAGVYSLCYVPRDHCLYLTQPLQGLLEKISLDDLELKVVLKKNNQAPLPKALCLYQGSLCLSDRQGSQVFKYNPEANPASALVTVGKCDVCTALAASKDRLYGISGENPNWVRVAPPQTDLPISPWFYGFQAVNYNFPIFEGSLREEDPAPGLVADPRDDKRLLLASPGLNQILSLRDYDFHEYLDPYNSTPDGISDFDYPSTKPPGTYRLMICGDSHIYRNDSGTCHMDAMAKRLEIQLNTEAALENLPTRFQVMNLALQNGDDQPPYYYPAFLAPKLAQKYDVDEILLCLNAEINESNLAPFHQRPLGNDEVPLWEKDAEFLLEPFEKRVPKGRIGEFLKRHLSYYGQKPYVDMHYAQVVQDPKDREEVAYMFSRPVLKLKKELEKIKTRSGEPVKVRLCYFPTGPNGLKTQVEPYRSLWKSVADQAGVSFADLTEPFLALRPDYFPVAEICGASHPTTGGYVFKALLLSDWLIREKWIPFEPIETGKKNQTSP